MPDRRRGPRRGNIVLGMLLLARGKAEGFDQFGYTLQAFLSSLAPLIAVPVVGYLLLAAHGGEPARAGGELGALSDLLATICALLAPAVLSYELAKLWRRQALWLRFATALNWSQWVIPVLASVLLLVGYPLRRRRCRTGWRSAWWGSRSAATRCGCTGSSPATGCPCRACGRWCWWWWSMS